MDYILKSDFEVAVREFGHLFEILLREMIQGSMASLPFQKRKHISDAEAEIGDGKRGIESFTLGQLVALVQKCRICDEIAGQLGKDARSISGINLNIVRDIRNQAVHGGQSITLSDARFVAAAYETFLAFFDVQVDSPQVEPRNLEEIKGILERSAASVEVIEGTPKFFKRLTEIVDGGYGIDRFDATYLSEFPPRVTRNQTLLRYWNLMEQRTLAGSMSVRRIVNFNNQEKLAWILFGQALAHRAVLGDLFQLAIFSSTRDSAGGHVMVPNIGLAYSSEEMTDGHAWIYQHEDGDRQNYIFFRGKSIFSTYRRIYNSWFGSCRRLDASVVRDLYISSFGMPESADDVRLVMKRFSDRFVWCDDSMESASNAFYESFLR